MKNRLLLCFCLLFLLLACEPEKKKLEVDDETMIKILSDFHIAEEMISKFREDDKDSVRMLYLSELATIYKMDTSSLIRNIEMVQQDPELAFQLYQEVYKHLDKYSQKPENNSIPEDQQEEIEKVPEK